MRGLLGAWWPRASAAQLIVLWCIAAVLLVTIVLIPAVAGFDVPRAPTAGHAQAERGRVVEVLERTTVASERGPLQHERLAVEVGGRRAEVVRDIAADDVGTLAVEPGDGVLVTSVPGPDGPVTLIVDRDRSTALWVLALAFVAMVVLLGRVIGASSLLGLVASLLVIVRFVVPGILSGHNPELIAISGALVIMGTTLYLAHGINLKTTVALAATAVALLATAGLAAGSIAAARLSGVASEDTATLLVLAESHVPAASILLGGIIIGALGVLNDVTVAQASAVFELREANPALRPRELYARAMRVGRDHISATVNTLVLAYAGASLPLLMLLAVQGESLPVQLNREFFAAEVVRSLVGSMGLVTAVPLTTLLAALVATRE